MINLLIHFLLLGAVIFCLAEFLPKLHVEGYGTALAVAVIYGLINVTLGSLLMILSLPFMIITIGLFKLIINTFLLWITDQLIDDFEIEDLGTTFVVAVLITISDTVLAIIF
jgi:putative membrane protein|tara:strand:- start:311 stop:646 length:336 start_codon:yes stop_codon:yes gene_type:complete